MLGKFNSLIKRELRLSQPVHGNFVVITQLINIVQINIRCEGEKLKLVLSMKTRLTA